MPDAMSRFMVKVKITPECWEWIGTRNKITGRAYFKVGNKNVIASRWIWAQTRGEIPAQMTVMHSCDNPSCVRLAHLSLGTQVENISDRDSKGRNRLSATNCVNGHAFTEENTRHYGPDNRWRMCRACARINMAKHRANRAEAEAY